MMCITFEIPSEESGKMETIILHFPGYASVNRTLHKIGLDLCASIIWANRCRNNGGLTLRMLLQGATPEMFARYGATLARLPEANMATTSGNESPISLTDVIVTPQELKSMEMTRAEMRSTCYKLFCMLKEYKENHHPTISTWNERQICWRATLWAESFVASRQTDVESFFQEQLKYAMPSEPPFECSPADIA